MEKSNLGVSMATVLDRPKVKNKTAAPGTYLGFAIQPVRQCHHLLLGPANSKVSMEYVDDIAIHGPDGTLILEQCKSALKSNPIADGSVELWKTFATWATLCSESGVDPKTTTFRLYVCTSNEPGALAVQLHEAKSDQQAADVLDKIAGRVTPKNAQTASSEKITQLTSYDGALIRKIICNFELIVGTDPLDGIRTTLRATIPDDHIDDFANAALGRVSDQVAALIRDGETPIIDSNSFVQSFQAYVRKYNWIGVLPPSIEPPTVEIVDGIVRAAPRFVQQLKAIEVEHEVLLRAAADFMQSEADRTHWAAEGVIVEESISELDDHLERSYSLHRSEVADTQSHLSEAGRGRTLYNRCSRVPGALEGRQVPTYFVPGSYNILANDLRVGWHPEFELMFED
jgi:hypothetical protein